MCASLSWTETTMNKEKEVFVKIDNWGEMEHTYLVDMINKLRSKGTWTSRKWKPIPALIDKNGRTSTPYLGQNYDPNLVDLIPDGWDHDHCDICTKTISDKENYRDWVTDGYNLNNDWICEECYNLFMVTDDIEKELEKYQKVEK